MIARLNQDYQDISDELQELQGEMNGLHRNCRDACGGGCVCRAGDAAGAQE